MTLGARTVHRPAEGPMATRRTKGRPSMCHVRSSLSRGTSVLDVLFLGVLPELLCHDRQIGQRVVDRLEWRVRFHPAVRRVPKLRRRLLVRSGEPTPLRPQNPLDVKYPKIGAMSTSVDTTLSSRKNLRNCLVLAWGPWAWWSAWSLPKQRRPAPARCRLRLAIGRPSWCTILLYEPGVHPGCSPTKCLDTFSAAD